jgi:hypothetical protein
LKECALARLLHIAKGWLVSLAFPLSFAVCAAL